LEYSPQILSIQIFSTSVQKSIKTLIICIIAHCIKSHVHKGHIFVIQCWWLLIPSYTVLVFMSSIYIIIYICNIKTRSTLTNLIYQYITIKLEERKKTRVRKRSFSFFSIKVLYTDFHFFWYFTKVFQKSRYKQMWGWLYT
jgi:hypothetical protein